MNKIKAIACVTTLAAAGSVMSQEGSISDLWKSLDADQNGHIDMEEAKSSTTVREQWSKLDKDQNQTLSIDEFSLMDLTKEKE
jgi:hypothetical protein